MRSYTTVLSGFLVLGFLGACTQPSRLDDSLVNAIRDTGFVCAEVSSSYDLTGDGSQWRVVCENAHVYLASLEQDGQICVSPFAYVDAPAYVGARPFAETSLESLPYIVQLPLQDFDVVRCTPEGARPG